VVVGAALDHHVELDRRQARGQRGVDAGQHVGDRKADVVHALEDGVVQRVQADGRAAGRRPAGRALRARMEPLVVRAMSTGAPSGVRRADNCAMSCSIWRRSRLAAGQAQLAHAQADEHGGGPGDLLEAQQRGMGQEVVLVIEHLLGHAVAAAEVAAVGDRDAQVAQGDHAHPAAAWQTACPRPRGIGGVFDGRQAAAARRTPRATG
jgi:hypothetical protein